MVFARPKLRRHNTKPLNEPPSFVSASDTRKKQKFFNVIITFKPNINSPLFDVNLVTVLENGLENKMSGEFPLFNEKMEIYANFIFQTVFQNED